jgi:sugar transferase (PEP-CTERM/EpsH1 system associated)
MKILMLAHRLPYPPQTGDKVRAYHIARHLAQKHELTLAFLVDEPRPEQALSALQKEIPDLAYSRIARTRKRLFALFSLACGGSATLAYFHSPDFGAQIDDRLSMDRFDLIYVSSSSMAQYVRNPHRLPIIMDFVDVDSDKWLQYSTRLARPKAWVYRLEGMRLQQHELAAARQANRCIVATRQEEALLHSFAPWAPTTVIENGVDLDYFTPSSEPAQDSTIVFTGAMDYFPNIDAVLYFSEAIFPKIRARLPGARFLIVGKNPAPVVRRLASRRDGVEVTGQVPDVRPFFQGSSVGVAPLRVARGIQNKVLEAMAMGLPVVATSKAHEGLDARPGRHLFIEDDPGRFADLVVKLLDSPQLRAAVGGAARSFVEDHHSWTGSMAKLDRVLAEVTRMQTAPTLRQVS